MEVERKMFHRGSLSSGGVRHLQKVGPHVAPQGRCWTAKPQMLEIGLFILIFHSPRGNSCMASGDPHRGMRRNWVPNLNRHFDPLQGVHLPLTSLKALPQDLVNPGFLHLHFLHRAEEGMTCPSIFHFLFISWPSVNPFSTDHHLCPCHFI